MTSVAHRIALGVALIGLLAANAGAASEAGAPPDSSAAWSPGAYSQAASIPGAQRIGSEECISCHDKIMPNFHRSVHGTSKVSCEDCHGPGSLHSSDEAHGHIHTFVKQTAQEANGLCLRCHAEQTALHGWDIGRHWREGIRCTDCHEVHALQTDANVRLTTSTTCTHCHQEQEAQGRLPYHHPVLEGRMGCADCHDPHGSVTGSIRDGRPNDLCLRCHNEYRGPFTYQHPPVVEDCLKCHAAHGSMNAHLLQASEPMLCLQCHAGHHNGSGIPLLNACTNCHSSIHGSDTPSATGGSVFIDK